MTKTSQTKKMRAKKQPKTSTAKNKSSAKKHTTKKSSSKSKSRSKPKKTPNAPESKCFWVNNGPVIKNLEELAQALQTMTDEQFSYHTERGQNDFANWVHEVLAIPECANRIRRAQTRAGLIRIIRVYVS